MALYNNTRSNRAQSSTRRDGILSISETEGTKFLNSDFIEVKRALVERTQDAISELTGAGMVNMRIPAGITPEQMAVAVNNELVKHGAKFGTFKSEKNAGKTWLVTQSKNFIRFFVTSEAKEQRRQENLDALYASLKAE